MDFRDYYQGLISLSFVLFVFSLTFMIGSYIMKPYIALEPGDLTFILILSSINLIFCTYYIVEARIFKNIFVLADKHLIRYGKRIGIVSSIYIPHVIFLFVLFFHQLHELEKLMLVLIIIMELSLLGLVFKEVHDLVFLEEQERKHELEKNRQRYGKPKRENLYQ
ncbi:MAG: hypothetical protein ACTSXH_12500 [Promethearchaeota archaeon]